MRNRPTLEAVFTLSVLFAAFAAACGGKAGSSEEASPDAGPQLPTTPPTRWASVDSMEHARGRHTATRLASGGVLVTGGTDGSALLKSAELYSPKAKGWTTTAPMAVARASHTATLLNDGTVLIAGGGATGSMGFPLGANATATAELFDPQTEEFAATGSMGATRSFHTAVRLDDGRVLVAGGASNTHDLGGAANIADALDSAEIYDPATRGWTATGAMKQRRMNFVAVKLPSGKVLVVGGANEQAQTTKSVEIFDPATGTWSDAAPFAGKGRVYTAGTLLNSGKVLVVGGVDAGGGLWLADAWTYDPAADEWSPAGNVTRPRSAHMAALLPSGHVLVGGGGGQCAQTCPPNLDDVRVYDPAANAFDAGPALLVARSLGTMTTLASGEVLVAGGMDDIGSALADAEVSAH